MRTSVEALAGVGAQEISDGGGEDLAKFIAFLFADAGNAFEGGERLRVFAGEGAERVVAKNNVGGDLALVGEFFAERAETFEENFVASDVALAARGDAAGFGRVDGLGERDGRAGAENVAAGFGELDRGVFAGADAEVAEAQELAADAARCP